jgi:hypothetical protein
LDAGRDTRDSKTPASHTSLDGVPFITPDGTERKRKLTKLVRDFADLKHSLPPGVTLAPSSCTPHLRSNNKELDARGFKLSRKFDSQL